MKAAIRNRTALFVIVLLVAALLITVGVVVPGQTASYNNVSPESASGGELEFLCPDGTTPNNIGICVPDSNQYDDD